MRYYIRNNMGLEQGFPNGGKLPPGAIFVSWGGQKGGQQFKIFGNELILDILELQMKPKTNKS